MAIAGDQTVYIGNEDWYRGDPVSMLPQTDLTPETVRSMQGGYVRLDGSSSYSLDSEDVLYWEWYIDDIPIGSSYDIGPDNYGPHTRWQTKILTRQVDQTGRYIISLQMRAANGGLGVRVSSFILSTVSNAPLFENIALDTSWVWQLLPNFWSTLPQEDRHKIELIWRGVSQTVSADLLDLFSVDNDKSIATIQDRTLHRWKKIDLDLSIQDTQLIVHRPRESEINVVPDSLGIGSNKIQIQDYERANWKDLYTNLEVQFQGRLISGTELIPTLTLDTQYFPQRFDEGSFIEIRTGGRTIRTKILYVDFSYRGRLIQAKYIVDTDLFRALGTVGLSLDLELTCTLIRLSKSIYPIPCILYNDTGIKTPAMIEAYSAGGVATLSQQNALVDIHTHIKTLPSILLRDADIQGISPGDFIYFQVQNKENSKRTAVRLEVQGIIETGFGTNVYHVIFDTLQSTYKELLSNSLKRIHGDEEGTHFFEELDADFSIPSIRSRFENETIYNGRDVEINYILSSVYGVKRYHIQPIKITRLTKVGLTSDIQNIIKLSEFIEEHEYVGNGTIVTDGRRRRFLRRRPLFLLENRDFYLQTDLVTGVSLSYDTTIQTDGHALFTDTRTNFLALGVNSGDQLRIEQGLGRGLYTVIQVEPTRIKVRESLPTSGDGVLFEDAPYTILPKLFQQSRNPYERYLIFNTDALKTTPPTSLWAETYIQRNHKSLDANFGALLNFPYQEYIERGLSTSYRSILTALLAGRIMGSSIETVAKVVGILSGIPYAEERSRVIKIDKESVVDSITGDSTFFKVIVESVDANGEFTQNIRTYDIPAKNELTHETSSGVAYGTGADGRLRPGDILEQFELVGLGVLIEDLINNPRQVFKDVQDRHKFRIRINFDSTTLSTVDDIKFLQEFVFEIKPSYLDFILSIFKYFVDVIEIESRVSFKLRTAFFDDAYLLRGPADIYDDEVPGKLINMAPAYLTLSTWFPRDGIVTLNDDGTILLYSETGYFTKESIASGILSRTLNGVTYNYRHLYTIDPINPDQGGDIILPWIRGVDEIENSNRTLGVTLPDYVVFRGTNTGMYRIKSVQDANHLVLVPHGPNQEDLAYFTEESVPFVIARLVTDVVYDGVLHVSGDNAIHLVGEGIVHDGIGAHDEMSFPESTQGRYIVRGVRLEATDKLETSIFVNPYGKKLLSSELTAPSHVIVRRPCLATRDRGTYDLVYTQSYGLRSFSVQGAAINNIHSMGVDIGDLAHIKVGDSEYPTYVVGVYGDILWVADIPNLTQNQAYSVRFEREDALQGHDSYDQKEYQVRSACTIIMRPTLTARNYNLGTHTTTGLIAQVTSSAYGSTLNTLKIINTLPGAGSTLVDAINVGDLLQVVTNPTHLGTLYSIADHLFVDGYGILRIVEVINPSTFLISNPLPLLGTHFIGMELDVKLIKQARLSSVQWRFNHV